MILARKSFRFAVAALSLATVLTAAGSASAATWAQTHPRRVEVNTRLATQNSRIRFERLTGQISGQRAHRLHAEVHLIRRQEQLMASTNHGRISKGEKHFLNREENISSHHIGI